MAASILVQILIFLKYKKVKQNKEILPAKRYIVACVSLQLENCAQTFVSPFLSFHRFQLLSVHGREKSAFSGAKLSYAVAW